MENNGINKTLLICEATFTGIFLFLGIFFYIHASILPKPEGTVLTSGFVYNYVNIKIYKDLGFSCLIGAFSGVLALMGTAAVQKRSPKSADKVFIVFMIIFALSAPGLSGADSVLRLINYNRVETVQATRREARKRGKYGGIRFILYFSNGSRLDVTYEEYKNYTDGATYYVIMNGYECMGSFSTDEYTLPEYHFDR